MNKIKFIFALVFVALFLLNEPCFAQARREGSDGDIKKENALEKPNGKNLRDGKKNSGQQSQVMKPLPALNLKEEAAKLQNKGWKAEQYSIAAQLESSWRIMAEIDTLTLKPLFVWAQNESKDANKKKAQTTNYQNCTHEIYSQLMAPLLAACKTILVEKKWPQEKIDGFTNVVNKSAFEIINHSSMKSMELFRVEGKTTQVRTMMINSRLGFYKMLPSEMSRQTKNEEDYKSYKDIVATAYQLLQIEVK